MVHEHAVTLKLPPFWTTQPRSWFTQAEAQFIIRGIVNDDTKYYYILASLDQDTAARLLDLLENPPAEGKYQAIKAILLDTFGLSELERASQLLHIHPLGAAKPSELMNEMLALLVNHPPCLLFKQLFLQRLPEDIRTQLIAVKHENCRAMAKQADLFWSAKVVATTTNALEEREETNSVFSKKKPSTSQPNFKSKYCFYHWKWGKEAKRCQNPCAWSVKEQASHK